MKRSRSRIYLDYLALFTTIRDLLYRRSFKRIRPGVVSKYKRLIVLQIIKESRQQMARIWQFVVPYFNINRLQLKLVVLKADS